MTNLSAPALGTEAAGAREPGRSLWWFIGTCLMAAAAALFSGLAEAQPVPQPVHTADSGEYRILEARYGTEERNVDVTQRLRELARRDQRLRLTNDLMGTDPDPGRVKTLRIHARHVATGRVRTLEYGEGGMVDGAMFIGWGGGQWGGSWGDGPGRDGRGDPRGTWGKPGYSDGGEGEYRIVRALYGTAERHVDVTSRLREMAQAYQSFELGNRTFGGNDPDPGRAKTLRIFAIGARGEQRVFEYAEGSAVDGARFSSWGGGHWGQAAGSPAPGTGSPWPGSGGGFASRLVIVNALYGSGPAAVDVTQQLRDRVRDGRLSFLVNNSNAGTDPAPGVVKSLTVTYRIDGGREQRKVVSEGQTLALP